MGAFASGLRADTGFDHVGGVAGERVVRRELGRDILFGETEGQLSFFTVHFYSMSLDSSSLAIASTVLKSISSLSLAASSSALPSLSK